MRGFTPICAIRPGATSRGYVRGARDSWICVVPHHTSKAQPCWHSCRRHNRYVSTLYPLKVPVASTSSMPIYLILTLTILSSSPRLVSSSFVANHRRHCRSSTPPRLLLLPIPSQPWAPEPPQHGRPWRRTCWYV
jgi:hypothetical protein